MSGSPSGACCQHDNGVCAAPHITDTMIVIRLFEFQIRTAAASVTVQLPGVASPSTRHNLGEVLLISYLVAISGQTSPIHWVNMSVKPWFI